MSFGEPVAELTNIASNSVLVNLNPDLLEVVLYCRRWIIGSESQTQIYDRFAVQTAIVEQRGEIGRDYLLAVFTPESLILDGDPFEPVVGDENRKDAFLESCLR